MGHSYTRNTVLSLLTSALLLACASSEAPPAEAPEPASPEPANEPAPAPPEASADAEAANEAEATPEAAPEPEPEPEPEGPSKPPVELITETEAAFMIDYPNSAPKQAAESKCAGDDPKVRADCLKKERGEFFADVITFNKSDAGAVTFVIYQRRGSQLLEIYRVAADLEEKSKSEVLLTLKAKGKGTRTLLSNERSTTLKIPDDYTLLMNDARHGELKYSLRLGLVDKK